MYDWSKLTLHPMTHALHYGTSVFEGIRAYETAKGPAVFRLEDISSVSCIRRRSPGWTCPTPRTRSSKPACGPSAENKLDSCYNPADSLLFLRNLGLVPKASPVELVIAAWEWGAYLGEKAERGVTGHILPWRRVHHSQLDMKAKLGGIYMQSTICGSKPGPKAPMRPSS